ncbi:MAG: leucine-rich repeat domain-containing protein, partial [Muribaculaceae bacterium]|nr:leucine-rich repeat domain-containing protein [Muribaculaceae bacterium]
FPDSIVSIGKNAFAYCQNITSLQFGKSLTTIGDYAFDNIGLEELSLTGAISSIGSEAFNSCIKLKTIKMGSAIESIGAYAFLNCTNITNVEIPDLDAWCQITFEDYYANPLYYGANLVLNGETLKDIVIPSTVSTIHKWAFSNYTHITSLDMLESVSEIERGAFYGCTGLTTVKIPASLKSVGQSAFGSCSSLERVEIADIGAWASINFFYDEANPLYYAKHLYFNGEELIDIDIPSTVTAIGDCCFYGFTNLRSVVIPNSVTTIGRSAFYDCINLESVIIGNSVTETNEYTFRNCSKIRKCAIPAGHRDISSIHADVTISYPGEGAIIEDGFIYGPDKTAIYFAPLYITSYEIPASVKTIGAHAFQDCAALTSMVIPNNVISIAEYGFHGCSGLKKSAYPADLYNPFSNGTVIAYPRAGSTTRDGFVYGNDMTSLYFAPIDLKSYEMPSTVTTVVENAFFQCTELENIELSPALSVIGKQGFKNCSSLSAINLPASMLRVGDYAFDGCTAMKEAVLGPSVRTLGSGVFNDCSALESLTSLRPNPPSVGSQAFKGVDKTTCVLYVDEASIPAYQAASQWKEFLSIKASGINNITMGTDDNVTVYDTRGVRMNINRRADLNTFSPGVYIINGTKQRVN